MRSATVPIDPAPSVITRSSGRASAATAAGSVVERLDERAPDGRGCANGVGERLDVTPGIGASPAE